MSSSEIRKRKQGPDTEDEHRLKEIKLDENSSERLERVNVMFLLAVRDATDSILPDDLLKIIVAFASTRCGKCTCLFYFPSLLTSHIRLHLCAEHPGEMLCQRCIRSECTICGRPFCVLREESKVECPCGVDEEGECGECKNELPENDDDRRSCDVTHGDYHEECIRLCRICKCLYSPRFFTPDAPSDPDVGVCAICHLLGFSNSWQGPRDTLKV